MGNAETSHLHCQNIQRALQVFYNDFTKGQVWFGAYLAPIFLGFKICFSFPVFIVKYKFKHLTVPCNKNFLFWWSSNTFSEPLKLPYLANFCQFRPFSARKRASKYLAPPTSTADFFLKYTFKRDLLHVKNSAVLVGGLTPNF